MSQGKEWEFTLTYTELEEKIAKRTAELQATIEELTGAKVRLSTIVDMQSLQNKHLQATITELTKARDFHIASVAKVVSDARAQSVDYEATITELTGALTYITKMPKSGKASFAMADAAMVYLAALKETES